MTRVVGQFLAKRWGQSVLVDNRPGGGTVIAGALVAKAPADGYTLIIIANPHHQRQAENHNALRWLRAWCCPIGSIASSH